MGHDLSIRCATCAAPVPVRPDDAEPTCLQCYEKQPLAPEVRTRLDKHARKLSRAEERARAHASERSENVERLRAEFMIVTPALTFVCVVGCIQLPIAALPRVTSGELPAVWLLAEPFLAAGALIGTIACVHGLRWYRTTKRPTAMPTVAPAECPSCAARVPVAIGRVTDCPFCTKRVEAAPEVVARLEAAAAQRIATEQASVRTARRWMRVALTLLVAQALFAIGLQVAGHRIHLFF